MVATEAPAMHERKEKRDARELHVPVLGPEIVELFRAQLGARASGCILDGTLGLGGHSELLLRALPALQLIGLDQDPRAIELARTRLAPFAQRTQFFHARLSEAGRVLQQAGAPELVGMLCDLGVSSMQLDDPTRGFTFKTDSPLDLRLNPSRPPSAADWLARVSEEALAAALTENADEHHAALLARELIGRRGETPFTRTLQLAATIRNILRVHQPRHDPETADDTVRRVFQALRIAVNDEFGVLDLFLRHLTQCLKSGGRVAILTFHSGEDRRVKQAFREGVRNGFYTSTNEEVVRAGPEERRANPRSSSAKLRWAVRA
jgi:16S rRNA (cytosine1402-N4)-methyltransferase